MKTYKCEYIWLDGYQPEANLRSKTKVVQLPEEPNLKNLPTWSFDGSFTKQATASYSDCVLNPIRVLPNGNHKDGYLVMCEVLNLNGTPHETNQRAKYSDTEDFWFGFEQEYVLMDNGLPLGFTSENDPSSDGLHYCGNGANHVLGRNIVEEHLDTCLASGLNITGVHAEVMKGKWVFQLLGKGGKTAADDLWMARFLLMRIAEKYGYAIEFTPNTVKGVNGAGMYTNFSNAAMREVGGENYFKNIIENFKDNHEEHIEQYGSVYHAQSSSVRKVQSIDTFSYGISDRGASISIPMSTVHSNWKGYLEDRRPASNACPYKVSARIINSVTTEAALI